MGEFLVVSAEKSHCLEPCGKVSQNGDSSLLHQPTEGLGDSVSDTGTWGLGLDMKDSDSDSNVVDSTPALSIDC